MALDPRNRPFSLPLSAESFGLIGLALRAVARAAVNTVERMASLAVCFLRVDVADRPGILFGVLARGDSAQVLRIDARTVPAGMVDYVSLWNGSTGQKHGDTVSLSISAPKTEDAVAVSVFQAGPNHAVAMRNAFGLKAQALLLGWRGYLSGMSGRHGD